MDDVKQKIQSKIKELYKLNQEFRSKHPELINNYWFNVILDRIKKGCTNSFGESFEPDNDLNQIDQAASFFNIDYNFYCEYQRGLYGSLSFCVIFDFSKPYDRQKAIKAQQIIVENNSQLNSKLQDVLETLTISGFLAFIALYFFSIVDANSIVKSIALGLGLITIFVGIIGYLVNNNRMKKILVNTASRLQQVNYH